MIKVITSLPRRADFSPAQFQRHWGTVHRDFALRIDRISGYVQSHPRKGLSLAGLPEAPYDGFPEVWFGDLDAALSLGQDPQYLEGAYVDEPRFIDRDRMLRTWVEPHIVKEWDGFADATHLGKILIFTAFHPSDDVKSVLGNAAVDQLDPLRVAIGTAVTDERVHGRQGYGCIVELWWRDIDNAVESWNSRSEQFLRAVHPHLTRQNSSIAAVEESRVRWPLVVG